MERRKKNQSQCSSPHSSNRSSSRLRTLSPRRQRFEVNNRRKKTRSRGPLLNPKERSRNSNSRSWKCTRLTDHKMLLINSGKRKKSSSMHSERRSRQACGKKCHKSGNQTIKNKTCNTKYLQSGRSRKTILRCSRCNNINGQRCK